MHLCVKHAGIGTIRVPSAVCGHVGRCSIFPKMRQKSVKAAQLRFKYLTPKIWADRTNGFYDLVQELRGQIFCYAGSNCTLEMEFGDHEQEQKCSHQLPSWEMRLCV